MAGADLRVEGVRERVGHAQGEEGGAGDADDAGGAAARGAVADGLVVAAAVVALAAAVAVAKAAVALLLLLSERGVCASAGAACSSGSLEPSPVLLAMGIAPEVAHGSVRFSLSRETSREEVERAAGVVAECVGVLSKSG